MPFKMTFKMTFKMRFKMRFKMTFKIACVQKHHGDQVRLHARARALTSAPVMCVMMCLCLMMWHCVWWCDTVSLHVQELLRRRLSSYTVSHHLTVSHHHTQQCHIIIHSVTSSYTHAWSLMAARCNAVHLKTAGCAAFASPPAWQAFRFG
jgi:hypothetical protein